MTCELTRLKDSVMMHLVCDPAAVDEREAVRQGNRLL